MTLIRETEPLRSKEQFHERDLINRDYINRAIDNLERRVAQTGGSDWFSPADIVLSDAELRFPNRPNVHGLSLKEVKRYAAQMIEAHELELMIVRREDRSCIYKYRRMKEVSPKD